MSTQVASTPKYSDCLQRKKSELTKLERKVDTGLDRTLNTLAGWVRTILNTEQKKSDFNPSFADSSKLNGVGLAQASSACLKVVKFVNSQVKLEHLSQRTPTLSYYESPTRSFSVIED